MNKGLQNKRPLDWKSILVLGLTPLTAAILIPLYWVYYGFSWVDWMVFGLFMIFTGLSITAGYHRLWSHRAYKANKALSIFFMLFGAGALQNSILKWSSDHRKHHKDIDDPVKDPYAATKGFWYSHILWMFRHLPEDVAKIEYVNDLKKDKIVMFQHRYYVPLAVFMCFILPMLIGATYGSIIGCFLLAGLLRLVLNHHFTFFINSLAHFWGKQTYTDENTAKDNPVISLVTYGEGYHNFHHKYAGDYRNGVMWYDFDPTKWLIAGAAKIGWASDLKMTSKAEIEAARANMQYKNALKKLSKPSYLEKAMQLEQQLEAQYKALYESIKQWGLAKQAWLDAKRANLPKVELRALKVQYRQLKKSFKLQKLQWRKSLA